MSRTHEALYDRRTGGSGFIFRPGTSAGADPGVAVQAATVLPRNTPVYLTLNDTLSTRSKAVKAGQTFTLSVSRNVRLGQYIVIPRGSRAIGTITSRTKKGGFGKSCKMEFFAPLYRGRGRTHSDPGHTPRGRRRQLDSHGRDLRFRLHARLRVHHWS